MKSKTKILVPLFLVVASFIFSQDNKEKRRTANSVEKVEQTVEEANTEIDSTVASIDSTIEGAKETAKKVGDIFFPKKNKKKASSNIVIITITSISYDNPSVNQLYNEISKSKVAKELIKTYSNGQIMIKIQSKATADAIWQKVHQGTRKNFNIEQISEKSITLDFKK
ncbi:hypothetical protein [Costertonia aggregata]|uniref:Uncharacterized protein n=1 Tax=Costertonia aggregata TaxID=343403 RepID=A0A7H9ANR2_9FLAO|nr:hypothetical protein [Costertonia aggregata]QLG45068.1 hypothetical protein HYG79_06795 [Costertonia aggregata]